MKNIKPKKSLFVIFIVALLLRLFAVIAQEESKRLPFSDAKDFDNIAVNIMSGHGFSRGVEGENIPTSFRPPLFPLFLAGIYATFGHSYLTVKVIQAILGALFCIVIFFVTDVIFDNKKIGILAAAITALYKPFITGFSYYGSPAVLYSEYFYTFILGLTILMTLFSIKKQKKIYVVLAGIFMGLTILTRFEFVLYPFFLFLYLFFVSHCSIKKFARKYLIMYLFIALTLIPWFARNYIVHERFIPLSTLGGHIFWMGNNSLANGSSSGHYAENYLEMIKRTKNMTEYESDRVFFREAIEELKANPKRIPMLFIRKVLVHWMPFENRLELFNSYYAVILLLGSIGIFFFRRRTVIENVLLIVLLSTTITAIVTLGDPRYRYPYEPCLIVFAALAIHETMKGLTCLVRKSTT